ncbi:MAG: BatD family protein [Burkholderiales bacterium]|nr:BatD family protein [Anaerolineae bacterium]
MRSWALLWIATLALLLFAAPVAAQDLTPTAPSSSALDRQIFVEASVNNPTPYIGQQVSYSFRFYTAMVLASAPGYEPPDFEGFWRAEVGAARQTDQQVDGRAYKLTEVNTSLYPTEVGELIINPSLITIGETLFSDEIKLQTDAVSVQVQPLPDGAPEGFRGAVGQFQLAATLDRVSVAQGEPLTLRLTVTGTGNVEQLTSPELPVPPTWRVYENQTSYSSTVEDDVTIGEKVFEWQIIPDQPGPQTLPIITLSYFDPAEPAFRSVSTAAVPLDILPAADGVPTPMAIEAATTALRVLPLKPVPAVLEFASSPYPAAAFWVLWALPPGVALASWMWVARRSRQKRDEVKTRRSKALLQARKRLKSAERMPPKQAYQTVAESIVGYFGDKLNQETRAFSHSDLQRVMAEQGIDSGVIGRVLMCVEMAEAGRFAPVDLTDVGALVNRSIEALTALDKSWRAILVETTAP